MLNQKLHLIHPCFCLRILFRVAPLRPHILNLMTATKFETFCLNVGSVYLFACAGIQKCGSNFISQIETLPAKFLFISQYDPAGSYYFTIPLAELFHFFRRHSPPKKLKNFRQKFFESRRLRVSEKLLRGALFGYFTGVHEHDAAGDFARESHFVGDDDHRHSFRRKFAD